jgi:ParB-like nuclease domain
MVRLDDGESLANGKLTGPCRLPYRVPSLSFGGRVIRYVPPECGPPVCHELLGASATKRSMTQKAESIRSQGVLSPLLVRPLTDQSFEIIAGARRYRAAQIAEAPMVPVRIVNLTDAEALEAQLIELSIVVKRFLFVYAALRVIYM